jgi:hypothetical protein
MRGRIGERPDDLQLLDLRPRHDDRQGIRMLRANVEEANVQPGAKA